MRYFLVGFSVVLFIIDRFLKDSTFLQEKICNTGIAFGVPVFQWLLFGIILGLLFYIALSITQLWKKGDIFEVLLLITIFLGAFSNLWDRFLYGCVIDYIHFIPYFPWFNIADTMIFFGVVFTGVTYKKKKSILGI